MRLEMILPRVRPETMRMPQQCPYKGCSGRSFKHLQAVTRPVRDTQYTTVEVHRYRCLRCGRTFRVYPEGVDRAHFSQRAKGLAVMLYLLGLSNGAVSLALEALGLPMAKSTVYKAVQAAVQRIPGLKRKAVFEEMRTPAVGVDVTTVKVNGKWYPIGIAVDSVSGVVLSIDGLTGEDAETLREWVKPILEATGAEILVSDDADGFKEVADELGLKHQVCKSHVQRNTERLVEELVPLAEKDVDGSLGAIGVTPQQATADLRELLKLVRRRDPADGRELERLHKRYIHAPPPKKGEKASVAYRLRLLFLDRWNLWPRLTEYRTWKGKDGEQLDGSNNASERAIGWWIKERYRTMRGYKREESAVGVSRLLAWCGNQLNTGGADLAVLLT